MSTAADRPRQDEDAPVTSSAEEREPDEGASTGEIEADIARTRRELGETVESLSDRLDPKAQADRQIEHLKGRARVQVDHARQTAQATLTRTQHAVSGPNNLVPSLIAALAGAAVCAGIGLLMIRRR